MRVDPSIRPSIHLPTYLTYLSINVSTYLILNKQINKYIYIYIMWMTLVSEKLRIYIYMDLFPKKPLNSGECDD